MDWGIGEVVVASIGLLGSGMAGYVSIQNRLILTTMDRKLAELENRIVQRINGTYTRRELCDERKECIEGRLTRIEREVGD